MSWFSRVAGHPDSADETERRLLAETAFALSQFGVPEHDALAMAKQSLAHAKATMKEKGLDRQRDHIGDVLLATEATDPKVHDTFEALRADGVRNDDILDWWNRPALERVMLQQLDEQLKMTAFISLLKQGCTPEAGGAEIHKAVPEWGEPNGDPSDDRPLPFELRARFTRWTERNAEKRVQGDERRGTETLNAAIRRHMREGTF